MSEPYKINEDAAKRWASKGVEYASLAAHYDPRMFGQALAYFERALTYNPFDASIYVDRAHTYVLMRKDQEAILDCIEAIKLDPQDAGVYNMRGHAYLRLDKYETALYDFNRTVELEPANANSHYSLATCYAKMGKGEDAAIALLSAIKLNHHMRNIAQSDPFFDNVREHPAIITLLGNR